MNSASSNSQRSIRVEFLPKERRSWCAGATRSEADRPSPGATGWTAFFRMPGALRKRLKRAGQTPAQMRALETTPAALPARADGAVRAAEPAPGGSLPGARPGDSSSGRASREEEAR